MEPADAHLDSAITQRSCQIERVWKLVRLHSDEHHHSCAGLFDHARKPFRAHARIRFVERINLKGDIFPEHMPLGAIARQTIDSGE